MSSDTTSSVTGEGARNVERSDRGTPNVVLASGPDKALVRLEVAVAVLRRHRDAREYGKIGEYCGLIHGNIVERSDDGRTTEGGTQGVLAAHALFRGLKRPITELGLDGNFVAYVSKPDRTYGFPDPSGAAVRAAAPVGSVFVVYARFESHKGLDGFIPHWEWVLADAREPSLPVDFEKRYEERIW